MGKGFETKAGRLLGFGFFRALLPACLLALLATASCFASTISLNWSPVTGVTGYKVYYQADSSVTPFKGTGAVQGASPVDNGNLTSATITGLDPAHAYYFAVTAYNSAGVESSYSNTVAIAELTPPTVSITSPANNAVASGTVSVTANATDNVGVTRVEFYVNGVLQATDSSTPYLFSWNTAALAAGSYTLSAKAYDAAGNVGTSTNVAATVVNDTIAPTVSLSAPVNGATVSGTVAILASASDNVGVTKVEFYQDGSLLSAGNVAPYSYSWNSASASNGSHTLSAKAYDAAGNVGQSSSVTVTVNNPVPDTQAPSLTSFTMPASAVSLSVPVSSLSATDNVAVTGYLITESSTTPAASAAGWSASAPTSFTFSAAGARTAYAWAKDAAGNVSAGRSAAVTITLAGGSGTGLVAAYSFDEGTGTTVTDKSGLGNNGTIVNASWSTAGKYGSALSFNGTNSMVTIPDSASLHLTTGMTMEAWVKPTKIASVWQDVIYKGNDNYYLEATSPSSGMPGGAVKLASATASSYAASGLTANAWTHLALTYDGSTVKLYVGGALVSSKAQSGSLTTSTNALQIGGDSIYGEYFNGTIDEVRVYNVPLTQSQIQSDMITAISGSATADTTAPSLTAFAMPATASALSVPVLSLSATDNTAVTGYLITESASQPAASAAGWSASAPTSFTFSAAGARTAYAWAKDAAGNVSLSLSASVTVTLAGNTGLVAAFSFDEGTGTTVIDKSGLGNNGTISNATWTTAAKYGKALSFNGTNSFITIADSASLHLTTGMTLEAWVNPSKIASVWQDVIYKGNDNYYLEATSPSSGMPGGAVKLASATASSYASSVLTANTWTHLALTYDGSTVKLYVGGVLVSSKAQSGSTTTSANPLQIGGDSIYGEYFNGTIDEVRVYNVPLTQSQIQADMSTPIGL